jgi:glycosyltransferase involved in cell wall biosynthesis/O-antigen/teichoic acid export membrane protein
VFDDRRRVSARRPVTRHRPADELTRALAVRVGCGVRALSTRGIFAFSRQTGLLLFALGLLNASNYLFHVVVSRQLGPSDYGAVAALLAVLVVLSVPLGVLQTVVAQRTAALQTQGRSTEIHSFAGAITRTALPIVLAASGLALLLAAPLLSLFLDVGYMSASLLAPYLFLGALGAIPLGVLQGAMRFGAFVAVVLGGVAVRLASGIGLVDAGFGVPGAIFASTLAAGFSLVLGLWLIGLRGVWPARTSGIHESVRGDLRVALYALLGFWLIAQADIALARHYLKPEEAGFYSSAGLLARALLVLPAAVALVAFPRFVSARERGEGAAHWLRASVVAGGALVLAGFVLLVPIRGFLVELTFGERYAPAAELMPLLCLAMAAFGLVGLLTYFHIAMRSKAYVIALGGLVAEIVLVAFFHSNGQEIAAVVTGVALAVLLAEYAAARSLSRWRPPRERLARSSVAPLELEPSLEVSIVLPCHNAARGLRAMLEGLVTELEAVESYELIVVSDGSTDETVAIAQEFAPVGARVLDYPQRAGKGYALQVGLTEARGRYVAFVDADGDIGAEAIGPFLGIMGLYEPDIVLGSKRHPLSEVEYPPLRRLMSWSYHKLTRLLFRVNVRDTQTGLKLVRREVLADVLPRLYEKRYAFDLELLVVARSLGYRRVFEAPVRVDYQFSSQIRPASILRIAMDTAAIFYRQYVLGSYAADGPARSPATRARVNGNGAKTAGAATNGKHRILVLNWRDIRNPDAGGAEVVTHEVAKRWVEWGHEVTLLTSRFPDCQTDETVDGVRVRRKGSLRTGTFHLLVQHELSRVRGFDVIIDEINTAPFLTPLWRRRLPPIVGFIHQLAADVLDAELPPPLAAAGRWLEPRALRLYRDVPVVTVSDSTRDDLQRIGLENVSVIPNGRDESPPLDGIAKEEAPTLLYVGRLAANKRPDHAVEAFRLIRRELPDARLWIVGQGPLERTLAADLPDGAELLGYLPREELYERMRRAHCLLVPSVREGWGLVVIEANSVGTPAAGYDVPGLRDSIRDGLTGRLASAGDPEALARSVLELLADADRYRVVSRRATEWADRFSWNETARQLLDVVVRSVDNADRETATETARRAA